MNIDKNLCLYYQAVVKREECWKLTALLRSFEHVCFDRTLDKEKSIFEFFVPDNMERYFLSIMEEFKRIGLVSNLQQLPNRLIDADSKL